MDTTRLKAFFTGLQSRIVGELETFDGLPFRTDSWQRPEGGGGISRLIEKVISERAASIFSHVKSSSLRHRCPPTLPVAGKRWGFRWCCIHAIPIARRHT
jgi:coproporphyrinogen III oxidase